MDDKYIQTGVFLVCDKGTIVVPFIATPKCENHHGITAGTKRDNIPALNILPFGACAIGGYPCIPLMPQWKNYPKKPLFIEDFQPLLLSSYCKCQKGGNIKVFETLVQAAEYLANLKNTRIDGIPWLDQTIGTILAPGTGLLNWDGAQSIGRGFRQGLYNTWDGIKSLGDLDTWKGLYKMAAIGVVGFYGTSMGIPIPPRTRLEYFDKAFGTDLGQTHDAIISGITEVVDQKIINGTDNEHHEAIGQIYAAVVEAVVGTKGTALAIKGGKSAIGTARLAKMSQAINKAQRAMKLSRLKEAAKGLFRKKGPKEAYNRKKHYGNTPKKSDRKHFGATSDEVVDHDPPLVKRYYEGDPKIGEKPGYKMTKEGRIKSANDRKRMKLQPKKDSQKQGGEMSKYSKDKKKKFGL